VERKGFARILRQAVQVDPMLARLYTESRMTKELHG